MSIYRVGPMGTSHASSVTSMLLRYVEIRWPAVKSFLQGTAIRSFVRIRPKFMSPPTGSQLS